MFGLDEICDRTDCWRLLRSHHVEYFWKALHPELSIEPLVVTANIVVEIKSDRTDYW